MRLRRRSLHKSECSTVRRRAAVECPNMIEDSPEAFIQHWRSYAAEVQVFARTEGSPLLECRANGVIVQLLDRGGPYVTAPGTHRVILNPVVEALSAAAEPARSLEVAGLGQLQGTGEVLVSEGRICVVDCGVPLVVAVMAEDAERFEPGRYVRFEGLPPVHGFVVPPSAGARRREAGENTDDAM